MKVFFLFAFVCVASVWAQALPAPGRSLNDLPDDAVIAEFPDGAKFTMRDYRALQPQQQQAAIGNPQEFLNQLSLMRKLSKLAEQNKLDQQSPLKEQIELSRMIILSQAQVNELSNSIIVEPPEIVKTYDLNKEKYKTVKVKAIYIAFNSEATASSAKGKKELTEDQAKAKAGKLATEIRGGADFAKLAKENSDDETSRDKGGDFATLRASDNVPDQVRAAVFALKQGEISEPVRQQNGYYVFRADEVKYRPLSEVRDDIFSDLKMQQVKVTMDKLSGDSHVKNVNPLFLGVKPATAGPGQQ